MGLLASIPFERVVEAAPKKGDCKDCRYLSGTGCLATNFDRLRMQCMRSACSKVEDVILDRNKLGETVLRDAENFIKKTKNNTTLRISIIHILIDKIVKSISNDQDFVTSLVGNYCDDIGEYLYTEMIEDKTIKQALIEFVCEEIF